jgi:hypothetical protein
MTDTWLDRCCARLKQHYNDRTPIYRELSDLPSDYTSRVLVRNSTGDASIDMATLQRLFCAVRDEHRI